MVRITASFDDGCQLDERLAKLCLKYKVPTVFYIPVDYLALAYQKGYEPLTPKTYRYIADNFEIGSHGVTHSYLTSIPIEEAKQEIYESKIILENLLGKPVTKFCYPRGYYNDEIKELVKEAGYEMARTTQVGVLKSDDPYATGSAVHIGCPVRPEYEGTTWVDYGIRMLDKAQEEAEHGIVDYHLWGHSHEIDRYNEWDNVERFFKELAK